VTAARRRLLAVTVGAVVAVLGVAGCGGAARSASPPASSSAGPSAGSSAVSGAVHVFAAASLREAFERLADEFAATHPGVTVTVNFGASSALAQQILTGAPADVFAAASPAAMAVVTQSGDAAAPAVFARNRMQIAVPAGNPGRVAGPADLARPELKIALCAPEVPCGAGADRVLAAAGVRPAPDTLERDVKAAVSKVLLGEVDAALVYRTDVLAAGEAVDGIAFPEADEAVHDYEVAAMTAAPNQPAARAFVSYVLSTEGQRALADAGFERG
jgi:molybdate transport system substrate-binding protein